MWERVPSAPQLPDGWEELVQPPPSCIPRPGPSSQAVPQVEYQKRNLCCESRFLGPSRAFSKSAWDELQRLLQPVSDDLAAKLTLTAPGPEFTPPEAVRCAWLWVWETGRALSRKRLCTSGRRQSKCGGEGEEARPVLLAKQTRV